MNLVLWLVAGGLLGWYASTLMHRNDQQDIVLNAVVGIVGAMLGGWLIAPMVGVGTIAHDILNVPALMVALLGAVILLGGVSLFRRGSLR
jgi:uncharacterized membrane protein YeaQ/YmgE (transglycosylase-associated protein family)